YTEQLVWMPDAYLPTDDKAIIAPVPATRAQEGLPQNAFVFAAFGQTFRLTPEVFDIWMRLLQKVSNGVLWLSACGQIPRENLQRRAASHGVNPNRLIFGRFVQSRSDHLARQRLADLFLATYPYTAHSTASDALWAGLPVLVCQGEA